MKYIALSLLIGFIAINIFNFGFMSHSKNHTTSNCIASVIDRVICPQIGFDTALHHIDAYQSFSKALILPSISAYLLLIIVLFGINFIFSKYLSRKKFLIPLLQHILHREYEQELNLHRPRKITAWLSLFENSPSFLQATS